MPRSMRVNPVPANPNPFEAYTPFVKELLKDRPVLEKILVAHHREVAAHINAVVIDPNETPLEMRNEVKVHNGLFDLLNATNKKDIIGELEKIGIRADQDDRNVRLGLSAVRNENLRATQCQLSLDFSLSSRKDQEAYHKDHPMMMFTKSLENDLKLLEKKSALANTLMTKSHHAIYAADREAMNEMLHKLEEAAYALAEKLIILEANCKLRESIYQTENSQRKMQAHLETINYLLQQLDDVHANVSAAKAFSDAPVANKTTHHGVSYKRFDNIEDAKKAAPVKPNAVLGGLSAGSHADKLLDYKNIAMRDRVTGNKQYDLIHRRIKINDDETLDTASIQYKTSGEDGKEGFRQDSIISEELQATMGAREGFPPNNIPAKHVMEWAIQEVSDFHQQIDKGKETPTIFIHPDGYHRNQVEAMVLVCMSKQLKFNIMNANPIKKLSEKDLQKRLEKAKAHPEYGAKLQTPDELSRTVEKVTVESLNKTTKLRG